MRKNLKVTLKTKKKLDSMKKLYGVFLWAKWGILELPWTGKFDKKTGLPLVYIYYDFNGEREGYRLDTIRSASSGTFYGWYEDHNTADDIRLELNDKLQGVVYD